MRALAALLVVFHHAQEQLGGVRDLIGSDFGVGGVDIFFVISGFVMFYTTGRAPLTAGAFMARRIVRIVPLYWFMTVLTALLLLAAPHLVANSRFTLPSFIQSLLFWPHVNPGKDGSLHPMLKLGWTLNFEMFFYLAFAAALRLRPSLRLAALAVWFSLVVALAVVGRDAPPPVAVWGDSIVYEFLLGGLFALVWRSPAARRVPLTALCIVFVAGLIALVALSELPMVRLINRGIPALFMVGSILLIEQKLRRPIEVPLLMYLGDASYSIYLAHLYAIVFFRVAWARLHLPHEDVMLGLVYVALCVVTGTLGGCALYTLVERPLTQWVKVRLRRGAPGRAAAV